MMEAKVYFYAVENDFDDKISVEGTCIASMATQGWVPLGEGTVTFDEPTQEQLRATFAATKAERDAKRVAELKAELAKLERA